jgi:hypothetical protein
MELYKQYLKEREDAEIDYNDKGFMCYKVEEGGIFILDAYVKKEHRKEGITRNFLNNIIEKTNAKKIYTSTDKKANNQNLSENVILNLGFEKIGEKQNTVYYLMEIK